MAEWWIARARGVTVCAARDADSSSRREELTIFIGLGCGEEGFYTVARVSVRVFMQGRKKQQVLRLRETFRKRNVSLRSG
jgi:hypothetical protein